MATLAQLRAEPWWEREIVTVELDWLGDELCRRTGRPRTSAGTKGDRNHLRGAHRSQEWIKNSRWCTNRVYTVQGGLSPLQERYIAGFDFTPGSVDDMIAQSKRILAAMRAGRLNEVREAYGNVDGDRMVDGFDNVRDRAASSDSSHLWHWHLSIDRRHLTDRPLMERILAITLGEEDDDMTPQDLLNTKVGSPALGERTVADWLKGGQSAANKVDALSAKVAVLAEAVGGGEIVAKLNEIDLEATERAAAEERRDADLRALVAQAQSGELSAEEVVNQIAARLAAGTG